MASTIYVVRHAESEHNVSKDFSHRDPPLTALGITQASGLAKTFPDQASVAVILTSPLTRAVQTTLAGFSQVIDKQYIKDGGIHKGALLIVDPDLQERSDLPCDTGSGRPVLEKAFERLDLSRLDDNWFVKDGLYASDDASVEKRAKVAREKLWALVESLQTDERATTGRKNVAVVTHGVFMKFLVQDDAIDLPKAGWKAFAIKKGHDGEVELVPTE